MVAFAKVEAARELAHAQREWRIMQDSLAALEDHAVELRAVAGEFLTAGELDLLADIEAQAAALVTTVRLRLDRERAE